MSNSYFFKCNRETNSDIEQEDQLTIQPERNNKILKTSGLAIFCLVASGLALRYAEGEVQGLEVIVSLCIFVTGSIGIWQPQCCRDTTALEAATFSMGSPMGPF